MNNYYEILEISPNASQEVIEKAYRTLAKKYHPDSWPKDKKFFAESKFREITEAYQVLSNEYTRRNYDIKIGINDTFNEKYNELYQEHEQLKQEIENMKNNTEPETNRKKKNTVSDSKRIGEIVKSNIPSLKELFISSKDAIKNEFKKPKEEQKKDMIALILSILIVAVIVFVFIKVPFLKKLVSP